MEQKNNSSTVIGITVSAEDAAKLYSAYLGLPTQRKEVVKLEMTAKKISLHQAAFNEIFVPKLNHYVEKGEKVRAAIYEESVAMLGILTPEERASLLQKLGQAQ